jgi:hypothetical protein
MRGPVPDAYTHTHTHTHTQLMHGPVPARGVIRSPVSRQIHDARALAVAHAHICPARQQPAHRRAARVHVCVCACAWIVWHVDIGIYIYMLV